MSIPTKKADLIEWSGNLLHVCLGYVTKWKLPSDTLTALVTQHTAYKALFEKCKTAAATKIDMQNKKDAKALFVPKLEKFIKNDLQNNDLVDNAGLVELGLHVPSDTHTPWPKPTEIPSTTVKTPAIRKAEIWFKGINAKRWGAVGEDQKHSLPVSYRRSAAHADFRTPAYEDCGAQPD